MLSDGVLGEVEQQAGVSCPALTLTLPSTLSPFCAYSPCLTPLDLVVGLPLTRARPTCDFAPAGLLLLQRRPTPTLLPRTTHTYPTLNPDLSPLLVGQARHVLGPGRLARLVDRTMRSLSLG